MQHRETIGIVRNLRDNPPQLARELDYYFEQLCNYNHSATIIELSVQANGDVVATITE
jgi:hypothetical protein